MMVTPLTDETNIAAAYSLFAGQMMQMGEQLERQVGYQGASELVTLFWHSSEGIWVLLEPERLPSRYWCAFGVDNPRQASLLPITCEINPPRRGINRRCAGLFIRDKHGAIYLAHSGRIGGGRSGIGKSTFLSVWGGRNVIPVRFPDGDEYDYIVIGRIDDSDMLRNVARFVHAVARFKQAAVG